MEKRRLLEEAQLKVEALEQGRAWNIDWKRKKLSLRRA